jgi:uncharacterized protein YdhG (YjbR/CyaY superfamily)
MSRMPDHKQPFETIDAYIKSFPMDVQKLLQEVRKTIRESAPDAMEAISYGIPTFRLGGKYLIYFAGYKKHWSLYPIPEGTAAFKKEIAPHVKGKGTLQFPLNQPVPVPLVKKVVAFAVKRNQART